MSDINERIVALEAQLAELKAQVATTNEGVANSRRDLFKKLALGAAGVAAVGVAGAQPAAALDGDPLKVGARTTTTGFTQGDSTAPGAIGTTFVFQNGDTLNGTTDGTFAGVLGGWASPNGGARNGVYGLTQFDNHAGVVGEGALTVPGTIGGRFQGKRAALNLGSSGTASAVGPSVKKGDIVFTDAGNLWVSDADGHMVFLGGSANSGSLDFFLLPSPVRVYDSRAAGNGPAASGEGLLAGQGGERTVSLLKGFVGTTPTDAVPEGAAAALFTLTVADTNGAGFLAAFSNAESYPGTSNINWTASDQAIATTTVSAVDATAKIKLHAGGNPKGTNFIIDVIAFYA